MPRSCGRGATLSAHNGALLLQRSCGRGAALLPENVALSPQIVVLLLQNVALSWSSRAEKNPGVIPHNAKVFAGICRSDGLWRVFGHPDYVFGRVGWRLGASRLCVGLFGSAFGCVWAPRLCFRPCQVVVGWVEIVCGVVGIDLGRHSGVPCQQNYPRPASA